MLSAALPARWRVHRASAQDAARLGPLCAAHAAYERCAFDADGHTQRLQAALAADRVAVWWLEGPEQGVAQGYASLTLDWSTLSARTFAHLDCLYLCEAARGQGAGQALVHAARTWAQDQGCCTMQWQTPHWNEGAIRFYQRLGAQAWAKQRFVWAW